MLVNAGKPGATKGLDVGDRVTVSLSPRTATRIHRLRDLSLENAKKGPKRRYSVSSGNSTAAEASLEGRRADRNRNFRKLMPAGLIDP